MNFEIWLGVDIRKNHNSFPRACLKKENPSSLSLMGTLGCWEQPDRRQITRAVTRCRRPDRSPRFLTHITENQAMDQAHRKALRLATVDMTEPCQVS